MLLKLRSVRPVASTLAVVVSIVIATFTVLAVPRVAQANDVPTDVDRVARDDDENDELRRTHVRGITWAGVQMGSVFDRQTHSLQLAMGFATRGHGVGVLVLPELDLGESAGGIPSRRGAITLALQGIVGRFMVGGGLLPVMDWLGKGRAIGIGLTAFVMGDVLRLPDDRALFLVGRAEATTMQGLDGGGERPAVVTGSAGLGLRF